jgi:hypothetical protein
MPSADSSGKLSAVRRYLLPKSASTEKETHPLAGERVRPNVALG